MRSVQSRLTVRLSIFIGFLCLLGTISRPASANPWVDFLQQAVPTVNGTVIHVDKNKVYAEIRSDHPIQLPSALPARVVRKNLESSSSGRNISKRIQARGLIKPIPDRERLVRFTRDQSSTRSINKGDQILSGPYRLVIKDRGNQLQASTIKAIEKLNTIETISFDSDNPNAHLNLSVEREVRLTDQSGQIVFGQVPLDQLTQPDSSISQQRSAPSSRSPIEEDWTTLGTVNRPVYDIHHLSLPEYPDHRIIALAGANGSIGFARIKQGMQGLRWHTMQGKVLRISQPARLSQSSKAIPLLVVVQKNQRIYSRLIKYYVLEDRLELAWSARDIWMKIVNSAVLGWSVKNPPLFESPPSRITLTESSWEWSQQPSYKIVAGLIPTTLSIKQNTVIGINRDGILTLSDQNRTFRSSQSFNQTPVRIKAPGSNFTVNLAPTPLAWRMSDGALHILTAENRASGWSMLQQFQRFNQFVLHHLIVDDHSLKAIEKTSLFSGYVTDLNQYRDRVILLVVNPDAQNTTIYQFPRPGSSSERSGANQSFNRSTFRPGTGKPSP